MLAPHSWHFSNFSGRFSQIVVASKRITVGLLPISACVLYGQLGYYEGRKTMNSRNLTPGQQAMVEMWERHTAAEFEEKSINATMATMTS